MAKRRGTEPSAVGLGWNVANLLEGTALVV